MSPEQACAALPELLWSLFALVVLAMLLERALAFLFEYHWFRIISGKVPGLKAPIAFLASWTTCRHLRFDILARLFSLEPEAVPPSPLGLIITAAVLAGGSAAAMTLFQGVLRCGRDARVAMLALGQARIQADLAEEQARRDAAMRSGAWGADSGQRQGRALRDGGAGANSS